MLPFILQVENCGFQMPPMEKWLIILWLGGDWTLQGNITTGADAHAIAFNADGTNAYVTNQGAGTVSVIDVATHSVSNTIMVGSKPNGIAIKQ
ncbi:MAG: hypothetical protein IPI59_00165 [Sphingobacteriales bacterium]|nr:hypothetical protein [Sphingobacteriales bacterium]